MVSGAGGVRMALLHKERLVLSILREWPGSHAATVDAADGVAVTLRASARSSRHHTSIIASLQSTDWAGRSEVWLHASIAHPERMPSYDDLRRLHVACYPDRYAYQVFVPSAMHYNLHPFALHLWGRWDENDDGMVLPEFVPPGSNL